eukprot:scaffold30832_cov67-Phaeocystis_antarctica.AAC.4
MPGWPRVVESATVEAAGSSTQSSGRAPSGSASDPGSAKPPRAARRALKWRRGRARALPRGALTMVAHRTGLQLGLQRAADLDYTGLNAARASRAAALIAWATALDCIGLQPRIA